MYRPDEIETKTAEADDDHNIARHQRQTRKRSLSTVNRSTKESLLVNNVPNTNLPSSQYPSMEATSTDAIVGAQSTPNEVLGPYDIVCGRNKLAFNNIGNRRFRVTIQLSMDRYMAATTRNDTSNVIKHVANIVRQNGGRFLRLSPDGKCWIELDKKHVHEKVGHALRDAAPAKRESDSITNNNFIGTRRSDQNTALQMQEESTNILNTPPHGFGIHRREGATSILLRRQLLLGQALDQWITTIHSNCTITTTSAQQLAAMRSHGSQDDDDDSKPPAIMLPRHQANEIKQASSLSPDETPKESSPSIPDGSGTCSIDRDHETFDHSSFGDHHDAPLDWQSDETLME